MPATTDLQTPVLRLPATSQDTVSINAGYLPVELVADQSTAVVRVLLTETMEEFFLSSFTDLSGTSQRVFSGEVPLPGDSGTYSIQFRAQDAAVSPSRISPIAPLSVIVADLDGAPVATPPASLQVLRLHDRIRIRWASVDLPGFLGVRVRVSTDSSGVEVPYTQVGGLVPNNNTTTEQVVINSVTKSQLSQDRSTRVSTTEETLQTVTYSSLDILRSDVGADEFYAMASTVVQDPDTHQVYDSVAVGPFRCAFVNLSQVSPTDFAPGIQPEEIAGDIVKAIAQDYSGLDQSPRSELRDLQVDPFALELSNASVRNWFVRASASLSALCKIDDTDEDGVSDPPATNPYKQSIAQAFRLTDDQVQSLIDGQFDVQAEASGTGRQGATYAIHPVTFYTQVRPRTRIPIEVGAVVSTIPDGETPSVSFKALGGAVIDSSNLDAYWIPEVAGWGVTLDCQCSVAGSVGSVGAGTIRTVVSGAGSPLQCNNLTGPSLPGRDLESNKDLAARVFVRRVTGTDSGSQGGYFDAAMQCYGIVDAQVVRAKDLEMLRDWDPIRKRHTYGCTDIYARGATFGQVTQDVPFTLETSGTQGVYSTYTSLKFAGASGQRIKLVPTAALSVAPAALVEVRIDRLGGVFLGTETAVWDPQTQAFYLNPKERSYTYAADGSKVFGALNSALIPTLNGVGIAGLIRFWSSLRVITTTQPIHRVTSVAGDGATGPVPSSIVVLDKTGSDPLLEGNSDRAQDTIMVPNDFVIVERPVTWEDGGALVHPLGEGIHFESVALGSDGVPRPSNVLSVRSKDGSTIYSTPADYQLVPMGLYSSVGIQRTASSSIPLETQVIVAYKQRRLCENVTLRTESITLPATDPVALSTVGVLDGVSIPASHGLTALTSDPGLMAAAIPFDKRYIKVFTKDAITGVETVFQEGVDFSLSKTQEGMTQIRRFVTGTYTPSSIPADTPIQVSYYSAEAFSLSFAHPQFLTQLRNVIDNMRHGGADTLAKSMVPAYVDMSLSLTLENAPTALPSVVDPKVRTATSLAVSMASKRLSQSDIVRIVRAIPGVSRVRVPLTRMARQDGTYILGEVIPTGTPWASPTTLNLPASKFPVKASSWVTTEAVLSSGTIPSGGLPYAFVGLLYEGEAFRRCLSLEEFAAATDPAFYLIGINDRLDDASPVAPQHYGKVLVNIPGASGSPSLLPFRVTYQVFGEASAQDIEVSPLEYLLPGQITIAYEIEGQS